MKAQQVYEFNLTKVISKENFYQNNLNVGNLTAGVYMVKVTSDNGTIKTFAFTKKLILIF